MLHFPHHSQVLTGWLYCEQASKPKFGSVTNVYQLYFIKKKKKRTHEKGKKMNKYLSNHSSVQFSRSVVSDSVTP